MATTFGQLPEAIGELPHHWWVVAVRGLAAIVFGILAFMWPGITLSVLILFYGAYAIVDGILALYVAVRSRGHHVWAPLLEGILGIGAGLVAFLWPAITALALLYVVAAWAIVTGVLEVIAAVRLRQVIPNEWALILSGALSVLFGLLLVLQPGAGALALVWLIGLYAVLLAWGCWHSPGGCTGCWRTCQSSPHELRRPDQCRLSPGHSALDSAVHATHEQITTTSTSSRLRMGCSPATRGVW